jgi:hypothetical protein
MGVGSSAADCIETVMNGASSHVASAVLVLVFATGLVVSKPNIEKRRASSSIATVKVTKVADGAFSDRLRRFPSPETTVW